MAVFRKKQKSLFSRILLLVIGIFLAWGGVIFFQGYGLYLEAIHQQPLESKVSEIRFAEDYTPLDQVSEDFIHGLLAVEDHRFYQHGPVDIISLSRAVVTNFRQGELAEGGSTITQQLAKNLYFSFEKKFSRKVAEVFVATDLEREYEKDEILELYINIIYFGNGYHGIAAASRGFFDTEPGELDLYQASLLAGLPKAPSAYTASGGLEKAIKRQEAVLEAMVRHEYLDEEAARQVNADMMLPDES